MQTQGTTRRERGDGSLFTRPSRRGGELWSAKWRADGKQMQRSLGPKRSARFHPSGLTKPEAEAKFAALRDQTTEPGRASPERKTLFVQWAAPGDGVRSTELCRARRPRCSS